MQDVDVTLDACELALKEKETGTKAQPQQKGLFQMLAGNAQQILTSVKCTRDLGTLSREVSNVACMIMVR